MFSYTRFLDDGVDTDMPQGAMCNETLLCIGKCKRRFHGARSKRKKMDVMHPFKDSGGFLVESG